MALMVEFTDVFDSSNMNPHYGHMDNEYPLPLFTEARRRLQEKQGVSDEALARRGLGLFVRQTLITYHKQVLVGIPVTVRSFFEPYTRGVRIYSCHELWQNGLRVCSARTEHFMFDLKTQKVAPLLEDLVAKLED